MNLCLEQYRLSDAELVLTPALLIYPEMVDANISATLRLMAGDANRWRPHLKTAKMTWVVRRLLDHGVKQFKCATTRELRLACEAGARDVLLAYPVVGSNARRVIEIIERFPDTRISVLVENPDQAVFWNGTGAGIFVDVNPGMDRTGIAESQVDEILQVARAAGAQMRGVHYYDGHIAAPDFRDRDREAHAGYDRLMVLLGTLQRAGIRVDELITSGTPAFPSALKYEGFRQEGLVHRASPGTVVLSDITSISQLPEEFGYQPAAAVLATVVSRPSKQRITCDAGHKSISADAGVPTCFVVGRPDLEPLKPSEEHLPIQVSAGAHIPAIGESLYLLPKHICPTVNNFDEAILVRNGRVQRMEPVGARGHEAGILVNSSRSDPASGRSPDN